jgi:lysophospholipase L1-like esterase
MARTGPVQKLGAAVAGILIAGLAAATVAGEEAAQPPAPAVPLPYSSECQGGTTEIVSESPLPNVAAALQKRRTIRILAIGSSAGRRQGGYTHRIERILKQVLKGANVVIINRGVSGELAANAALRLKNEVAINEPDLVIWQVGTNDALAFVPIEELAETVNTTVRWLKEHNVDVVLAGLQYVERVSQDDNYYRVRELLREIATKENVMIIRRYEAMQFIAAVQDAGGASTSDEFDRTGAGYNCLAQYLASAITVGAFGKGMSGRPLRSQDKQGK